MRPSGNTFTSRSHFHELSLSLSRQPSVVKYTLTPSTNEVSRAYRFSPQYASLGSGTRDGLFPPRFVLNPFQSTRPSATTFGMVFNHRYVSGRSEDGFVERTCRIVDGVMGDVGHYGFKDFYPDLRIDQRSTL